MRKVLLIVAAVVVVVCGAGGFFAYRAADTGNDIIKSSITPQQFEAQEIGAAETTVRDALPRPLPDTDERDIYSASDPTQQGKPAGSSCAYYAIKPITEGGGRPLYRFCFAGGELTEKKQIRVDGA